jgi:hypothetical protein
MFKENEIAILSEKAKSGLPYRTGERVVIVERLYGSMYDYLIEFDDGTRTKAKESELNKLTNLDKSYMDYLFTGAELEYYPTHEMVKIIKCDYINQTAEVKFPGNGALIVVSFKNLSSIVSKDDSVEEIGKFTKIGLEIGEFTDEKNKQYGSSVDATYKMIQVLMERYTYDEDNYLIPKSLLQHILLQVRMMDKQNRIFNNPSGEGDSESPYKDLAGYSLIGIDMVNNK